MELSGIQLAEETSIAAEVKIFRTTKGWRNDIPVTIQTWAVGYISLDN